MEIQKFILKKGWNFIAISLSNLDFSKFIENGKVLNIKSTTESYNKNVLPVFNTLKNLEYRKSYFVEVSEDITIEMEGNIIDYKNLSYDEVKKIVDRYNNILQEIKQNEEKIVIPKYYIDDIFKAWGELPLDRQVLWGILGWTQQTWDNDVFIDTFYFKWSELSDEQKEASKLLGFNEEEWNNKYELFELEDIYFKPRVIKTTLLDNNDKLKIDFYYPPYYEPNPKDWIGIYNKNEIPGKSGSLLWTYIDNSISNPRKITLSNDRIGTVIMDKNSGGSDGNFPLFLNSNYDIYLFENNSYNSYEVLYKLEL